LALGKPILDEVRRKASFGDPLEVLTYSLVNSMERAFSDLRDLIEWAITAWASDPLISMIREASPEDPEPGETEKQPETSNAVKGNLRSVA
jgi:hypothetical protein